MEPVSSYPPTTRPTTSDLVEMTPPTWSTPTDYTPQSTPFATPVEAVEALSGKPALTLTIDVIYNLYLYLLIFFRKTYQLFKL